ncbi:MAG: hypothetical protein JWO36_6601 [Myxococcales bacterium]|nr:hypothetical protein [Myxococcales bacterium]
MVKLLVGLLKGAVIGGGVGYGAYALQQSTDFSNAWLTYGLIGALVGLFVGRPLWSLIKDKNSTTWVAILKGAFGFGVGCGLYALVAKAISPSPLLISGYDAFSWSPILGGAIGAVYGGFVELDDAIGDEGKGKDKDKSAPVKQIAAKKK